MKRFLIAIALLFAPCAHADEPERWAVYYSDVIPSSRFEEFNLVVFDSDQHPLIAPLKQKGITVLGYLSLGEAEKYRSYYKSVEAKKLLLHKSALWKNHTVVDVRNPAWAKMAVDELIPPILKQGFDGIMIDTLDSAIEPENTDPQKFPGMKKGAIDLVKAVRAAYPDIKIMVNRGFDILPDIAGDIDMVMAESIYTDWVKNPKKPQLVPPEEYRNYVLAIKKGQEISPSLKVYSLDYWDMKDTKEIKGIYKLHRLDGFIPYVSTKELDKVYSEPK